MSALVLGSAGAQAEGFLDSESREVPIGTFNVGTPHSGFSVVDPPAGVPDRDRDGSEDGGSGRWFFQGWQRAPQVDADALFARAMDALDAGRTDDAQRLFERVISEAPRSPRAGEARQQLGRIYSNVETGATAPAALPNALPWSEDAEAAAVRPAAAVPLDVVPAVAPQVLHQARVSPSLDARFLQNAGDRVFFSAGSAVLGSRARAVLQAQARFLIANPALAAAIEGHADDGALPDEASLRLSQERAATVRNGLIAEGVAPERLTAYGRAREDRLADCPAPECLAQNRRVVTILLNRRIGFDDPLRRAHKSGPASVPAAPVP